MIVPDDLLVTCKANSSDKEVTSDTEFVKIFESFSSWSRLVKTIARLRHIFKSFSQPNGQCKGWHMCALSSDDLCDAEKFILNEAQLEYFSKEINSLKEGRHVSSGSSIISLSPLLDENGILCVGGRLNVGKKCTISSDKNPVFVPKKSHISLLLIRHFHELVHHQGRHITEGNIRSVEYWIIGVDTFGPWNVIARRTRGGQANHKRWAILFTCLVIRAIHIEVVEELSSSSFINAMRRFISVSASV
ncbi:Hypothetical predicted protein [Mytilus galloprovincialis]|uniref:Uncharacterized protein n=1 Tax=Mytilus galloprovincialis TaxID=29158 RepID=A0A8B6E9B0_MYTGA|nr:Hypothetical predicted protein [Mytilus galloprovincialis]